MASEKKKEGLILPPPLPTKKEVKKGAFSFFKKEEKKVEMKKPTPMKFPKIKKKLSKKESLDIDRTITLKEKEKKLKKEYSGIGKLRFAIRKEEEKWIEEQKKRNEDLKKLDEQIEKEMRWKENELKRLTDELEDKKKQTIRTEAELNKKLQLLNRHKQSIKQLERRRADINSSLLNKENELRELKTDLMKKETALLEKEKKMKLLDSDIKNNLILLDRKKEELTKRVVEVTNEINELRKNEAITMDEIKKHKQFLLRFKAGIPDGIKDMEQTYKALCKEENRVLKKVKELEKATLKYHKAEDSFKLRERHLKDKFYELDSERRKFENYIKVENERIRRENKRIDSEYKNIDDMKFKIRAVKEFKVSIPKLEARYKELIKAIEREEVNLNRITKEALVKRERLKDMESGLVRREKELGEEKKLLKKMQKRLIDERAKLSDKEFKEYLESELHAREAEEEMKEIVTLKGRPGIYDMIDKARTLIQRHKFDEAKKLLTQIQTEYDSGKFEESEKKKVYYDILELNTEIKLAALH